MFQLLIPALVIMKKNLPSNAYLLGNIEDSIYLPNIVRITITALIIARQPRIKRVLSQDIAEMFLQDNEYSKQFEEENAMTVFDDYSQLTENAYERFYSLMIVSTEQIYADIFWEAIRLPDTDIKAMNWFLYLYK